MTRPEPQQPGTSPAANDDPQSAAADAAHELSVSVGWLAASLLPGTGRTWSVPAVSADRLAERDAELRAEKHDALVSGLPPMGESPAPGDVAVMDLLAEAFTLADDLAVLTRCGLPAARSAFEDPRPRLDAVAARMRGRLSGSEHASTVESDCDDMTVRIHTQLGLIPDGQLLRGAICPFCQGRTSTRPAGGGRTLRFRLVLPEGVRTFTSVRPDDVVAVVVCEGVGCVPPIVPMRLRGRPAFPLRRWGTWLADHIAAGTAGADGRIAS